MNHELHHADCLDWMKTRPTDSVDLILGSPPYEDARTYGVGMSLKGQAWVDWMVPRVLEAVRICKGLVAIVVEGRTRNFRWSATPVLLMADLHRAGVHLRKPPAFYRVGIPGSGGPDFWRNDYEFIVCCTSGGKLPWSDNTATGKPCKYPDGGGCSNRMQNGTRQNRNGKTYKMPKPRLGRGNEKGSIRSFASIANPGNVIHCPCMLSDVVVTLADYADATQANPEAILRCLQQAVTSKTLSRWFVGIFASILTSPLLRSHLDALPQVSRQESSKETGALPDLWRTPEILGLLRQALPEIQKIWRSAIEQAEQVFSPPVRSDVIHCKVGGGLMGSDLAHRNEAPFPESLIEPFVRCFCPPDGTSYDPWCGSGSVAAVCEQWCRHSIGTDIRESQIELATLRIEEARRKTDQGVLF